MQSLLDSIYMYMCELQLTMLHTASLNLITALPTCV